jgi:L-ascorbate metabolism protein UlaG (beta-lactamase superfamily)
MLYMLYFILILLLAVPLGIVLVGFVLSAPRYKGPVSDHFNGRQFINPGGVKTKGFQDVVKWLRERERGPWTAQRNSVKGDKPVARVEQGIRITFINHTTFLIQTDGLNIITDPVYSERASPFSWAGPKRMREPGIAFEYLPQIDIVLLSHNHYDHLDIHTVKKLNQTFHPKFIVPLGVSAFLKRSGIDAFQELDWWQELRIKNDVAVQAVPAQHFSGRGTFDRDATLWCGYLLKRTEGNIYFAGDTGYNEHTFKEIGERCAPVKAALIPIGAYKPKWFMSPIHCSPDEAVQIHEDTGSSFSIASHFGTFPLADDGKDEAVQDLALALSKSQKTYKPFIAMPEGKAIDVE